jgi:membrane protein required for colicin V production
MTWLDYAVIGVIGISIGWGLWRGLVREIMSLAGWVMAFLAANLFAAPVSEFLPIAVSHPEYRLLLAFVVVFVLTLVVTSIAALLLLKIITAVGLGATDRLLGALFGLARALLILVAFALAAGLTRMPVRPVWKDSIFGPSLAGAALALKPWLPPALAGRLRYD